MFLDAIFGKFMSGWNLLTSRDEHIMNRSTSITNKQMGSGSQKTLRSSEGSLPQRKRRTTPGKNFYELNFAESQGNMSQEETSGLQCSYPLSQEARASQEAISEALNRKRKLHGKSKVMKRKRKLNGKSKACNVKGSGFQPLCALIEKAMAEKLLLTAKLSEITAEKVMLAGNWRESAACEKRLRDLIIAIQGSIYNNSDLEYIFTCPDAEKAIIDRAAQLGTDTEFSVDDVNFFFGSVMNEPKKLCESMRILIQEEGRINNEDKKLSVDLNEIKRNCKIHSDRLAELLCKGVEMIEHIQKNLNSGMLANTLGGYTTGVFVFKNFLQDIVAPKFPKLARSMNDFQQLQSEPEKDFTSDSNSCNHAFNSESGALRREFSELKAQVVVPEQTPTEPKSAPAAVQHEAFAQRCEPTAPNNHGCDNLVPKAIPHSTAEISSSSAEAYTDEDGPNSKQLKEVGSLLSSFDTEFAANYVPNSELPEATISPSPSPHTQEEIKCEPSSELQEDFTSFRPPTPFQDYANPTSEARNQSTIPPRHTFIRKSLYLNFHQDGPRTGAGRPKLWMKFKQQTAAFRKKKHRRSSKGRGPARKR